MDATNFEPVLRARFQPRQQAVSLFYVVHVLTRNGALDHQLAARELLELDVPNTPLIVEHEYPKARIQDRERLRPILQASIAFVRKIDEASACMFALQHEVLSAQGILPQGAGRQPYRS